MAAASGRVARMRRIDRAAVAVITLGGIGVVVAVLGILVFVASEAVPLFRAATLMPRGRVGLETAVTPQDAASLRAVGIDEYQKYLYTVEPKGVIAFHALTNAGGATEQAIPGVDAASVTSSSRTVTGHYVAAGLSDGRASLVQVGFTPVYEGEALRELRAETRALGVVHLDPGGRAIRQVSFVHQDEQHFLAGLVADDEISYLWKEQDETEHRLSVRAQPGHRITHMRVGRNGSLLAGDDRGSVSHWELVEGQLSLTGVSQVGGAAVTALEWALGGNSWLVATE